MYMSFIKADLEIKYWVYYNTRYVMFMMIVHEINYNRQLLNEVGLNLEADLMG